MIVMQIIRIKIRGFESVLVDTAAKKIVDIAIKTGAQVAGPVPLPTRIKRWTVLRSTNIDKRSQETFELRTSIRLIDIKNSNQKTIDALQYLELPSGVAADIQVIDK
ncbi:MAG: 30S ribosomal protein S10 [Candidatus Dojkabacteria bacterium]|nr:MAG: 30S ribosomal protein S10 [Candidatus Dojkabacteria bacterium]